MRSFANRRLVALAFVSSLLLCGTALGGDVQANSADEKPAAASKSIAQPPATALQSDAQARKEWRAQMLQLPFPKNGCFTASYPNVEWREVQCGRPSPYKNLVGAEADYVAQTSGNYISSSTGTFVASSSSTAGESGPVHGSGPPVANVFTVQMNSQSPVNSGDHSPFVTPLCGGVSGCSGWQQFVFSQTQGPAPGPGQSSVSPGTTPGLFVQYWLYNTGATCPALPSWALGGQPPGTPWNGPFGGPCWFNGPMTYVPPLTAADLPGLIMKATAGSNDTVTLSTTSGVMKGYSEKNVLTLSKAWTETEFNVFGDGGGTEATFASPTTLVVNLQIADGFPTAPTCVANGGSTGETNSLTLSGTPTVIPVESQPSIEFTETNVSPTAASCSHSVGDTHLETLDGLFYDFQAAGDFVLTQADPDFVVQSRQVSGAPSWPNADLNHAVATQMGKTRVAICVLPTRIFVDGKRTELENGKLLSLPDGVKVYRGGNTYAVMREGGDIVSAQIKSNAANTWIDVTVGVGGSAGRNARGLLTNPNGNVGELAARTGTVFAAPVSFADLYHPYADSWRVEPKETLLAPCGENVETGAASEPFYANDLEPQLAERTRALCTAAGVKEGPELDACTLDTVVLGGAEAAKVFVQTLPIRAVLQPGLPLKRIDIKPIKRP
jgi:hypothetical protein